MKFEEAKRYYGVTSVWPTRYLAKKYMEAEGLDPNEYGIHKVDGGYSIQKWSDYYVWLKQV